MQIVNFADRLKAVCSSMEERDLDYIVATHDGSHFIETPNPVTVLTGFKSLGPAICLFGRNGDRRLIVTPAWDAARARADCPDTLVFATADLCEALREALPKAGRRATGTAGLAAAATDLA